ncbi:MAG: putative DNA-binding domain-containing protein [Gammaproteobacteria bacterium]|nr:putative DNA-binding domain-containing protein [Gammaproteobacteria bacterium]MBU1644806.1 putative DNA-binding domain-containing protein [Gammaproteobacteria bacterium]MBU1973039.1 putative DNA-binding domain-containing protein [Gammaproteobacteria bacterium]
MTPAFQQFQLAFGRHLRDPRRHPRPAGVPARRGRIYGELLYNNLEGFLLACFPVTRRVLGERRWPRLVRAFFREARCHTPYFREIPREFLRWLVETDELPVAVPPWLRELAHYEWAELAVDVMDAVAPAHDPAGDLLDGAPVLAPALMNLAYAWPVQRIGPDFRPRKPVATQLLVFRNDADDVNFIELNPVAARLVALLQEDTGAGRTGRTACLAIAAELAHPQPDAVVAHGAALLAELRAAGAILGART